MAVKYGCDGIILSNHGGRQLDYARSGVEILVEVMDAFEKYNLKNKIEVFVDGGIRRGTDIFKCLALGAKCVGIGRPVLYGLACHGQSGVEKVIQLLKDEFAVTMRLMGTRTINDITKSHVIYHNLSDHSNNVPLNNAAQSIYQPSHTISRL